MATMSHIPPEIFIDDIPKSRVRPRFVFLQFLGSFVLVPLLAYFIVFPLVRSQSYARWSPSLWGSILDYAFQPKHQDAEMVIFGDSSAFIGVDPRIVNAQLGLKSIVLPATIGSLPVTDDLALQRYLKYNHPPRILVLYFSAWNLDYDHIKSIHLFEGEEMLFRHGTAHEIASYAIHHPIETFLFPLRLYSMVTPKTARSIWKREDRSRATVAALGHADDPDSYPPIPNSCTLPPKLVNVGSDATVQALVRRYSTAVTKVIVYLAPIPDCRNANAIAHRSFASLDAAAPASLPPGDFLKDLNYAHIRPPFVPTSSKMFADALRSRLSAVAGIQSARLGPQ
jgi:hypothetical protein